MAAVTVAKSTYINLPSGYVENQLSSYSHSNLPACSRFTIPNKAIHQEVSVHIEAV